MVETFCGIWSAGVHSQEQYFSRGRFLLTEVVICRPKEVTADGGEVVWL